MTFAPGLVSLRPLAPSPSSRRRSAAFEMRCCFALRNVGGDCC